MMRTKKANLDLFIMTAIITMMAVGFIGTLVALFLAPDVRDPFVDENQSEIPVKQVRETPRQYYRDMNIHSFGAMSSPFEENESRQAERNELIPDVPDLLKRGNNPMNPMMDSQMSAAILNKLKQPAEEDLLADEEDKDKSGWGWLADDIAKRRSENEEVDEKDPAAAEEDENGRLAEEDSTRKSKNEEDKPLYFMDAAFEAASEQRDPLLRPLMQENGLSDDDEQRSNEEYSGDDAYANAEDTAWDGSGKRVGEALAVHDPFTKDRESSDNFGNQQWGINSEKDNFSGMNYTVDDNGYSMSDETRYNYGNDDQSFRVVEAAGAESGRGSDRAGYFASDSMFNSGGGYTPQGISANGSDAAFSGSGLFGGSSVSVVTPTVNPSAGIGSSGSSLYKPSSSFGTKDDSGLTRPKTLPW